MLLFDAGLKSQVLQGHMSVLELDTIESILLERGDVGVTICVIYIDVGIRK